MGKGKTINRGERLKATIRGITLLKALTVEAEQDYYGFT